MRGDPGMRDLFSWLWYKPQVIWVLIPFALGTVVSTSVMRSIGNDEPVSRPAGRTRASAATVHNEKRTALPAVAGLQPKTAIASEKIGVTPKEPVAALVPREGEPAQGQAFAAERQALKDEMERKSKLEGEGQKEKSQAESLAQQIQQQKLMAQQLASKLAQRVAEQERELELRGLEREKNQAELVRQQEVEKLAELKRIAEENRLAKEKLIAEQARIAKDQEVDRARKLAEQEQSMLAAKLKAQREEEQRLKEERELESAREKVSAELSRLEMERTKAQKLRYQREKEFILEQLKVESLKAKLAAQERSLLERDMNKNVQAVGKNSQAGHPNMAVSGQEKKKSNPQSVVKNIATTKPAIHPQPKGKSQPDNEEKQGVSFVNVVIREAVDKFLLTFDILKADPRHAFAQGRVLVIGKYLDPEGKPVFTSSLAESTDASSPDEVQGISFKVRSVVKKNVALPRPTSNGKLVDLWIVARDLQGNAISTQRVAKF